MRRYDDDDDGGECVRHTDIVVHKKRMNRFTDINQNSERTLLMMMIIAFGCLIYENFLSLKMYSKIYCSGEFLNIVSDLFVLLSFVL